MVDSISTVALETLRDLLMEGAKFLSKFGGRVEAVGRTLNIMHSFLQDADNRKDRYDLIAVRNWVADLRDLSMEAESVLETYTIKIKSRRRVNSLKQKVKRFTCILSDWLYTHEIERDMDYILSRMVELTRRLDPINFGGASSGNEESKTQWSRKTYSDEIEEFYVGMEDEIESLSSLVTSDEISHTVILICGMGGLGKTTLAKKIYQSEKVHSCFQARAWVSISHQFEPKVIFQEILKQLLPNENVEQCLVGELVRKLCHAQRNQKCLVVLDDIWEFEQWDILRHAFVIVEACCKVLLTSRNANILTREHYLHKLRILREDEGCELLQKIALPANYAQELRARELEHLKEVGKGIVKKCGYLPLAIAVIGGILRQESSVDQWKKVEKNIDSYRQHGNGMVVNQRVTQILDLSYNALPYNLKPCFLYLGVFPEDEVICTTELYSLWIAEGMISLEDIKGRQEVLRDVAELYLEELANRCMVQVNKDEDSPYNRFQSCCLHDLMRDLCLHKGKEEEFLHVVDKNVERQNISSISRSPRLVIYFNGEKDDYEVEGNQKLRSLLLIEKCIEQSSLVRFGEFRHLKTLILKNIKFKNQKLPKGIEKLILLKLLHIEDCDVDELPLAICNISHLQYLCVCSHAIKMHNYLYRLSRLKSLHLFILNMEVIGGGKLKLHGLNELEILKEFDCRKYDYSLFESLRLFHGVIHDEKILSTIVNHILSRGDRFRETSLRIGRECNLDGSMSALLCNLFEIKSLACLTIRCHVRNLPTYKCPYLTFLSLEGCEIEEDPMVILGKLPKLKRLFLRRSAFVGKEMTSQTAEFPQLTVLLISSLPNLEEWMVGENSMPLLAELRILNCEKLKMIPNGLKFNTNLQRMDLVDMPTEFNKRVQVVDGKEGADWHKIKHIPLIEII